MNVQLENQTKREIANIYYYNALYSLRNAIETNEGILSSIDMLEDSPYLGRYVPELPDKRFREIIYRRNRRSGYRIIYYISEKTNTIYIIGVISCRQDFNRFLKLHNYFKDYYIF